MNKQRVLVQVAETLNGRHELTNEILIWVVIPQLVLILLAALAVYVGVTKGLAPLKSLQEAVARRTRWDLSPVDEVGAPNEVRPLVTAINQLLKRLKDDMEMQRRFLANAAHQLRTPLAGLKTQTEVALRQASPDDLHNNLKQVQTGVDRATHLVNQLLSLARTEPDALQSTEHESVNLAELARQTTKEMVLQALKNKIDLGYEGSESSATVYGDKLSLRELLSNLIDNAIRYTQVNGKVTVRVIDNGGVEFRVDDNGPGIAEEERQRVFERFYRVLGSRASGSGLGLSIVREIAHAHSADVTISEGPNNEGTSVSVKFPSAAKIISNK